MVEDDELLRAEETHLRLTGEAALALADALAKNLRFRADRILAAEMVQEARPALQSLLLAIELETGDDEVSLDFHEGVAMTMLLARRVALLGASPGHFALVENTITLTFSILTKFDIKFLENARGFHRRVS